jgi:hypothetical protein
MRKPPAPADTSSASFTLTRHPGERAPAGDTTSMACGACCCCCCCCLHTIGGLIGGVSGSVKEIRLPPRRVVDPNFPFPFRRDEEEQIGESFPPAVLYWLLVSLLLGLVAVYVYVVEGNMRRPEELIIGLLVGVMVLPGLQLVASVLACILIGLLYADRTAALARIGKITWYSFAGSMIGVVAMGGCCGVLALMK